MSSSLGKRGNPCTPETPGSISEEGRAAKRYKSAIDDAADEYVCPISMELPLDPVVAEDGRTYERAEIEKLIRLRGAALLSPVTNIPMGPKLLPAVQTRNVIEKLVRSGAIGGDKAKKWMERIQNEENVKSITRRAEGGDTAAMRNLGSIYRDGSSGQAKNSVLAYRWYKKAADCCDARGMATAGGMLVSGTGVTKNVSHGMTLIGMAAQGGSDKAAYLLGKWYLKGMNGLPRNHEQAKFWFQKIANGRCPFQHATKTHLQEAETMLKQLQSN